jgi:hypothetical protein
MDPEIYGPRVSLPLDPLAAACLVGCKRYYGWDQDTGAPLGTNETVIGYGLSLMSEGKIPTPEQYPIDKIRCLQRPPAVRLGRHQTMDPAAVYVQHISVRLTEAQTKRLHLLSVRLVEARRLQLRSMILGTLRLAIMAAWYDLGCPRP